MIIITTTTTKMMMIMNDSSKKKLLTAASFPISCETRMTETVIGANSVLASAVGTDGWISTAFINI